MAADETGRAQAPKVCDLCEIDSNIRHKCVDCNRLMCDRCRTIHSKVTTTHEIYDLQSSNHIAEKLRVDNICCDFHTKKFSCMFCKLCEVVVCPACISSFHQKHELQALDTICDEKLSVLARIESQTREDLMTVKMSRESLLSLEEQWGKHVDDVRDMIDKREQEIIDSIHGYAVHLRSEVERRRKSKNIIFQKRKNDLDNMEQNLADCVETIKNVRESKEGNIILSATIAKTRPRIRDANFIALNENINLCEMMSTDTIPELFGSLQLSKTPITLELQVIKSYSTNHYNIENILILDDETVWISTFHSKRTCLQKIKPTDTMEVKQEFNIHVFDMSLTKDNVLMLTPQSTSEVRYISADGKICSFIDIAPLMVKAIHVTKDDDVMVSVRDAGEPFYMNETSCRKIIVFSKDKIVKRLYEYDQDNGRLFTGPSKITTNINDDIVVCDWTSSTQGRLVVINQTGNLRWIYEGCPNINSGNNHFRPYGIVTTSDGNIVVADKNNHALHILAEHGELLTAIFVDKIGITFPRSLCIDDWGHLWIGSSAYQEEGNNAKLFVVKFIFSE